MRSPFKFLDAYTLEDKEVFFGRDTETDELYNLIYQTPMVLLYGMSGTGKTSLIQCGLASKYDGPDWYPIWIRRQDNINESLQSALQVAVDEPVEKDIVKAVSTLFKYYLRPIYLIFDQFEELFILGSPEEQAFFMNNINALLKAELPCKVIFVIREEYLGRLYHFEQIVPSLFDFRLRIEPMNNKKALEVINTSFKKFNISLEEGTKISTQKILNNISAGKSGIQLPYLQVYLDSLYRKGFKRQYPDQLFQAEKLQAFRISESDVESLGEIEDVLDTFLNEQTFEVQTLLEKTHPNLSEQAVKSILDAFVTTEGTKIPIYYQQEGSLILMEEQARRKLSDLPGEAISDCLKALESRRLLRFSNDRIELAHDSLAALIDQKRTEEQRQLNQVAQRISGAFHEFQITGGYLNRKQLVSLLPFLERLRLPEEHEAFIKNSEAEIERIENEERLKEQAELAKEKALRAKAETAQKAELAAREKAEENADSARRRTWLAGGIAIIALISAGIAFIFYSNAQIAKQEAIEARQSLADSTAQFRRSNSQNFFDQGKIYLNSGKYQEAITAFQAALKFDSTKKDSLEFLINRAEAQLDSDELYQNYLDEGEVALEQNELLIAIDKFIIASELDVALNSKQRVQNKIEATKVRMTPQFQQLVSEAQILYDVNDCLRALDKLTRAKRMLLYLEKAEFAEETQTIRTIEGACPQN